MIKNKDKFRQQWVLLIFLFLTTVFPVAGAPGDLDPTFNTAAYGLTRGNVNVIRVQPDGKILIGGIFTDVQGFAATGIARLNPDGTVDRTFKAPDFYDGIGVGRSIYAIELQPDGKILVGGLIYGINDVHKPGVYRLNLDGSLDPTFTVSQLRSNDTIFDIEVLSDGKILIGGNFQFIGSSTTSLARLNADGTIDPSFNQSGNIGEIRDFEVQSDGKIIVGTSSGSNSGGIRRYNANGTVDQTFPTIVASSSVETLKIQADGKILIGGNFTTINGFPQGRISRINTDGSLDLNFNLNNLGANAVINDIDIRPDGKIIIGGSFTTFNGITRQRIAQLNADGSLDESFQNNTILTTAVVYDVEYAPDGKVLVGLIPNTNSPSGSLQRFNTDGSHDSSFVVIITRDSRVYKITDRADGKIYIGGTFTFVNGVARNSLARLNSDGSLDTSFVPYFNGFVNQNIRAIAPLPDNKVLVGTVNGIVLRRLNADGSEDTSFTSPFTSSAVVYDIVPLPNGQYLVAGNMNLSSFEPRSIVRLNSNGSIDTSFAPVQPNNSVFRVLVQPDDKILIGGQFTQIGNTLRGRIARLNADGTLDNSFNPPGGANDLVFDLDVQPDGKVILGGQFTALNGNNTRQTIGRLNADGTLDTSFAQTTNAAVTAVKLQPDGRILIGGFFTMVGNEFKRRIARLNPDGSVSAAFNTTANMPVYDIDLQSNGNILLGGDFTKINNVSRVRAARLLNNFAVQPTRFDYDGDGKADLSVFRPSNGTWYLLNSTSGFSVTRFGQSNDKIAPADFDGDGKTDIAVWRDNIPNGNQRAFFYILNSSTGAFREVQFGQDGDVPIPADFDGDGKADPAVYRNGASGGQSYIFYRPSSQPGVDFVTVPFGLGGDKPVIGDYDGDGKADPAVFRQGNWYILGSQVGFYAVSFGIATDKPVPADYDGDGKTDPAVYRDGNWYILGSQIGFRSVAFGISTDTPAPADYDGDGKADVAVYRNGVWYQLLSQSGFQAVSFGTAGDKPTPAAFIQ